MLAAPALPTISFFARGQPMPKGSVVVRHIHGAGVPGERGCSCRQWPVPQSDAKLEEWDALVATAAKMAMRGRLPYEGAVRVSLTFYFARPKSHTRAQRANPYVVSKPDADKLVRACFDAMSSAAVWHDDAQGMLGPVDKRYADHPDERPGVLVRVEALT